MTGVEFGYTLQRKMPKIYKAKERAPKSGIYNVVSADGTFLHRQVTMERETSFRL